jgi:hypothetical protein
LVKEEAVDGAVAADAPNVALLVGQDPHNEGVVHQVQVAFLLFGEFEHEQLSVFAPAQDVPMADALHGPQGELPQTVLGRLLGLSLLVCVLPVLLLGTLLNSFDGPALGLPHPSHCLAAPVIHDFCD